MADLDLQLKIRALVEGINQVKALSDQVYGLNRAAGRPLRDPTAQLHAGAVRARHSVGLLNASIFSLKNAVGAVGVLLAGRELVRSADAYTLLRARIDLVTNSAEELAAVERRLFDSAQRTRSGYQETVALYARVARNAKGLGASQLELLQLTETVNQALQVGGATTQEAAAGTIQFAQALASGTLRGDELRSVLENMPRLAQAIVEGLEQIGVGANLTLGDLREMSEQGELSAQRLFAALLTQGKALSQEFTRMPRTVGGALTQLGNDAQRALAKADMSPLLEGIDGLRELLTDPTMLEAIKGFGTLFAQSMALPLIPARELAGLLRWFRGQRDTAMPLSEIAATGDPERLQARIANLRRTIDDLQALRGNAGLSPAEQARIDALRQEILTLERLRQLHARRIAGEEPDLTIKPPPAPDKDAPIAAAQAASALAEAAVARAKAAAQQQQVILDDQLNQGLISYRDYYGQIAALQTAAVDAEANAVRAKLALAQQEGDEKDKLAKIEIELVELGLQRAGIATKAAIEQAAAERNLAQQLDQVRAQLAQASGDDIAAMKLELSAQFRELTQRLIVEGDAAGQALIKRLIDTRLARAQFEQIERDSRDILSRMADAEQSVDARRAAGLITELQARRELTALHAQALTQIGELLPKMQALAAATGDPRALDNVRRLREEFSRLALEADTVATQINGAIESGINSALNSVGGQITSLREGMRSLLSDVVEGLRRIAAEQLTAHIVDAFGLQRIGTKLSGVLSGGGEQAAQQAAAAAAAATLTTGAAAAGTALSTGAATAGAALTTSGAAAGGTLSGGGAAAAAAMVAGATQAAAIMAAAGAAGAAGGGGGGGGLLAGLFHSGGIAGNASTYRRMPAVMMATAPRYHGGGLAGLKPDEVPAVLRRNEEVLTRDDPRHRFNGGIASAPPQVTVRNINLFDTQVIGDYLSTSAGEKVVLNVVSRNKAALGIT